MTDIYYIEDEPNIAQAVKEYLESKNCSVTVLETIDLAKAAIKKRVPEIILLDWNMPDGEGDRLCLWIRDRSKELPIIFLTVRGDSHDVVSAFRDGADDYVIKPFDLEVLYSRILALLRRVGKTREVLLYCDNIMIDKEKISVYCDGEEIMLSQPEYRLLLLLMENKGMTVMRSNLLEKIWDSSGNFVNDNTLTVTMKRLREKLHNPACIKTIRSFGYRMEDSVRSTCMGGNV